MGKLVSIVTTCLVGLSSRIIFDENLLGQRTSGRTVMVTTDRDGLRLPILVKNFTASLLITLNDKQDEPS